MTTTAPTAMGTIPHLGITGGIGAGKTLICRIFEALGIPIYNADEQARALMTADGPLADGIKALFGPEAYGADGALDRSRLAARTFAIPSLTNALNELVHPAVEAHYLAWAARPRPGVPYTLKEAALLFEAGTYKRLDAVINVSAPDSLRRSRALARDAGRTPGQIEAIMARQLPEAERLSRSQHTILNDGFMSLLPQVLACHERLVSASAQWPGLIRWPRVVDQQEAGGVG